MKILKVISIVLTIFCVSAFFMCSSDDNSKYATVTINTGLNNQTQSKSIATKAAAPSAVIRITVTVSGPGMETINEEISIATGLLTLDVPAGPARQFTILALFASGENYMGTSTMDLAEGTQTTVSITMTSMAGTATITIDLYLGTQSFQSAVPATIDSYTVSVSGADMETTEQTFTPGDTIEAPSGNARTITVTANVASGDPSAALSFRGSVTVNLEGGAVADVEVPMCVNETKIVIPDRTNSRIVQIDDIIGSGWTELTDSEAVALTIVGGDFTSNTQFRPYDVDIDSLGRIYIANNYPVSGPPRLIRIDNIESTSADLVVGDITNGVVALSIDRDNDYVYYAIDNAIYRNDYDGTSEQTLTIASPPIASNSIRGLAVDDNGIVYIACNIDSGPAVLRGTPGTTTLNITHTYTTNLNTPWDVMVKSSYVYVADFYSDSGSHQTGNDKIIQLTTTLQHQDELTVNPANPIPSERFYGPHGFAAILNNRFYIIDDGGYSGYNNYGRIVMFDDISGANWTTYGTDGTGTGEFLFFEYYMC